MKILELNDPFLQQPTEMFDFDNPPMDPQELVTKMKNTMVMNRGLGLSANQVGLPYSMFVMGNPDDPENIVGVFNPKVVDAEEEWYVEEGCLSAPGLFIKIKRPKVVRARYTIKTGETHTIKLDGMTARVYLHEYDHLQGITFKQRANRYHLEQAQKQKRKLDKLRKKRAI